MSCECPSAASALRFLIQRRHWRTRWPTGRRLTYRESLDLAHPAEFRRPARMTRCNTRTPLVGSLGITALSSAPTWPKSASWTPFLSTALGHSHFLPAATLPVLATLLTISRAPVDQYPAHLAAP